MSQKIKASITDFMALVRERAEVSENDTIY